MADDNVLFQEVQRFRQPVALTLVMATCLPIVGVYIYLLVSQFILEKQFGSDLVMLSFCSVGILIGLGVPVVFLMSNLKTEVRSDGLYVRFYPFHLRERKIELEKVVSFRAVVYRPIWDYGGWGLRFGRGGRAYNVSGRSGVRLEFENGKHLLIGSQRSEELAAAIEALLKT